MQKIFFTDYQSTSLQVEAVSLQTGTSTNLATEELEDEDALKTLHKFVLLSIKTFLMFPRYALKM